MTAAAVNKTAPPVEEPAIEKIYVPNVQSASLDVAKSNIENSGLTVGEIIYQESTQAAGTIISQNPAPDSYVESGTSIELVVAYQEEKVEEHPGEYGAPQNDSASTDFAPSRESDGEKSQ